MRLFYIKYSYYIFHPLDPLVDTPLCLIFGLEKRQDILVGLLLPPWS